MRKILENAWDIIRNPSNNNSQVALAIAVIVVASVAGLLLAFLYGFSARPPGLFSGLTGGLVALLSCVGAFAAGGMLGLLFGSPSWGNGVQARVETTEQARMSPSQSQSIRPNTSLERIADWLTTMIVGLSLVHLQTIEDRATQMGVWLTRAISGIESSMNGTPGAVLALGFSFSGFLLVYLWALRFLPSELRSSYTELAERLETVEKRSTQLLEKFKQQPYYILPEYAHTALERKLTDFHVDPETSKDILSRYRQARTADDEPMRAFGQTTFDGYELSARVSPEAPNLFRIEIELHAPEGSPAMVLWLLHNTFGPEVISPCPIEDGKAIYSTAANEAFWVGAVIPVQGQPTIKLSFDLRQASGATPEFIGSSS